MDLSILLRVVTLTNLRKEFEYLNSIRSGLSLTSFFLGFPFMILKEELVESFLINCFFFGSTKFLSKGLDSNVFKFFSESLLNRYSLFSGSIGEAYEEVDIILIGFGIRIPFFFKRKNSRLVGIFSIEMENGLEESVLGLFAQHVFLEEVEDDESFFFFSCSMGYPSFFFYNKCLYLEHESKCFYFPSLPFFFSFLNEIFFDPELFYFIFDNTIQLMSYYFLFESFLLSFSYFFSISTVNTALCEAFIYLVHYEKKVIKNELLSDLFFRLYARQRHSEVTTEMLDVFISIFSIELRGA